MNKIRRVDFYPDEFIAGVAGQLDDREFSVYWLICTLIYSRGGPIEDDPAWIARIYKRGNTRTVRTIIDKLVAMSKVQRTDAGLMVKRCRSELEKSANRIATASENGSKGGRPRKENNDVEEPGGSGDEKLTNNYQPATSNHQPLEFSSPSENIVAAPSADDLASAVAGYNDVAKRCGLPMADKLTETRRNKLRTRLNEHGPDGWQAALHKLEANRWMHGDNDRGWCADFDFLLQAKSFTRLIEGGYDRDERGRKTNGAHQQTPAGTDFSRPLPERRRPKSPPPVG